MKKIIITSVISVFIFAIFFSCSKDNTTTSDSTSIIGKWNYIGLYQNNKVVVVPTTSSSTKEYIFNRDSTYIMNSQTQDSVEYGVYSTGHGNASFSMGSITTQDSVVLYYEGPINETDYRLLQPATSAYQIKNDTLFLFSTNPSPSTSITVFLRNN